MQVFVCVSLSVLTCEVHFLSFQEHHVTAGAPGAAGMVALPTSLQRERRGKERKGDREEQKRGEGRGKREERKCKGRKEAQSRKEGMRNEEKRIIIIKEGQNEGQTGGDEHIDEGEGGRVGAMLGLTEEDKRLRVFSQSASSPVSTSVTEPATAAAAVAEFVPHLHPL